MDIKKLGYIEIFFPCFYRSLLERSGSSLILMDPGLLIASNLVP